MVDPARAAMAKQKRDAAYQAAIRYEQYVPTTGDKYPVPHFSTREVMRGRHRASSKSNKLSFKAWREELRLRKETTGSITGRLSPPTHAFEEQDKLAWRPFG